MVTTIGNILAKIIISDHATPASGTYAWYIEAELPRGNWRMPYYDKMYQAHPLGITRGIKQMIIDITWVLQGIKIVSSTEWDNLIKALCYWEANNTTLYLSVKNEWNSNIAQIGTFAAPTTLTQQTGHVLNLMVKPLANIIEVGIDFKFVNKFVES